MLISFRASIADRTVLAVTCMVVVGSLFVGCGSTEPTDKEQVVIVISNLADAARDAESFNDFFAKGAAPNEADRAQYSKYLFQLGKPDVSGKSAFADVDITNTDGVSLGELPWEFVLEDGEWKILNAPLP